MNDPADRTELASVPRFDVGQVGQLYGATEIVRLLPGDFLFREGDDGDALYIVKRGDGLASEKWRVPFER